MKSKNKFEGKLSSAIVLTCTIIILIIYLIDLKNDYYFHITAKKTTANIEKIEKVHEYKPYVITLLYSNQNTGKQEGCKQKLDGRFGNKIIEENQKTIKIFYTEQNPCDIYIEGYKIPTKGKFVIHIIISLIAFSAALIFTRKLIAPAPQYL